MCNLSREVCKNWFIENLGADLLDAELMTDSEYAKACLEYKAMLNDVDIGPQDS